MKYFTIDEFLHSHVAQQYGIVNVPTPNALSNLRVLTEAVLDPVREAWGSPILVSSGYRCEELNRKVGGSEFSYHRLGMAADIYPKNGCTEKLYKLIGYLFCTRKIGLTECYYDAKRGYIHIAHNCEEFNEWPFLTLNTKQA